MTQNQTLESAKKFAETFVETLIKEGSRIPCDETGKSFNENGNLPNFYNKTLFKRGQRFFVNNIFALLYSKFLGLISILAVPSINNVLAFTKMSGSPMTAYRRYLATVFHMYIWYKDDFYPDSKLWNSLLEVKNKHNSASKKCNSAELKRISQFDMAITQFGFMGFAVAKRENVGLYFVKNKDWEAFIHIWRVIGHIMGIEERFNICRESVEETREICKLLMKEVLRPLVEKKEENFITMASYLCEGMWAMNPCLDSILYLNLAYRNLQDKNKPKKLLIHMSIVRRFFYYILIFTIWSLQFSIVKTYHNYVQYMATWLMENFPFLAYYKYGYKNSHVRVGQ